MSATSPNPPAFQVPPDGLLVIPVEKIREDDGNARKAFRAMGELRDSVIEVGLVEPIIVTQNCSRSTPYTILSGHRRFRAAKEAGMKDVQAILRTPARVDHRAMQALVSNLQREALDPVDMAHALKRCLHDFRGTGLNNRTLARRIGKSESWVSGVIGILRIPPRLLKKLQTSEVALPFDPVIRISCTKDEEEQSRMVDALLNGATTAEIREQLPATKKASKNSTAKKPKRAFDTALATVIIQSKSARALGDKELVSALNSALKELSDCP